jgi:hypothetical protein
MAKTIILWEHSRPPEIENPNWDRVRSTAKAYMDAVESKRMWDGYVDEDFPHYFFEEVMTTLYGKDVWKYINERR